MKGTVLVQPDTVPLSLSLDHSLSRHDAYGHFAALGDLVVTGPTYTNVNDFRALLVL